MWPAGVSRCGTNYVYIMLCVTLRYVTKRCGAHYGATPLIWEYGDEDMKNYLRTIFGEELISLNKYCVGIAPNIGQSDIDVNLLLF